MASFQQLPNGSWRARIYVGRDEKGSQKYKSVTRPTLKQCKKAALEIEQQIIDGKLSDVDNIRIIAWIDQWLKINKNKYSPSTRALYKIYFEKYYKPFFRQMKFKDLRDIHLKKFLNELLEKQSSTSARRILSCLRPILYDALKDKSPFNDFKLPKEDKVDYSDVPDAEKFKKIYEAVKGTRDEVVILTAAWCGLRREEIFALRRNDLDFVNNTIRVDETYVLDENGKYVIKPTTKSENGLRTVSVPPYLMSLYKDVIANGFSKSNKKKHNNVVDITNRKNKNDRLIFDMRPDCYSSYLAKLSKRKNLPKIRLHFLRHYHATWLYENDVPDHLAAERLGHDIKVLKDVYQHLGVEKREKVNNQIITRLEQEINL